MTGKIQRLPLRNVWKHEALDFTTWLENNVDVLADVLGVTLSNIEREQGAGDFKVDLVPENDAGEAVVIENQLSKSDHDHLGKLLTYLAALDAKMAVWIVAEPRPEHVRAVGWLNESGLAARPRCRTTGLSSPARRSLSGPDLTTWRKRCHGS